MKSYINLITLSVYSVEAPPTFIVNVCKSQASFGSLELAVELVGCNLIAQRLLKNCRVSRKR